MNKDSMPSIVLRVRTQIGTWRLTDVNLTDTFDDLLGRLEKEHNIDLQGKHFCVDPAGNNAYPYGMTVRDAKIGNGHMIYLTIDESKMGVHEASTGKKQITKDGSIIAQPIESVLNSSGFRPGMLPLRSMKMQWTLNEFIALDEQFEYKIKAQKESVCKIVSLDSDCVKDFQSYMFSFDFQTMRVGYLYGRFKEDKSVQVEIIYEPPQETTATSFTVMDDSKAHVVDSIVSLLGLQKVGWIFAHPPREKGFYFSGAEVLFAAEQQLEAAGGVADTPFVTVKVTLDEKNQSQVEAFQLSKQCMEMVAEGVLAPSVNLGLCDVNNTFTAIVEGKPSKTVDNNFFLTTVPIEQFKSEFLVNKFPKANRIDVHQTRDDIKHQFKQVGKQGWTFNQLLGDFQLLLYLTNFLGMEDLPLLCRCVTNKEVPLDEGYQILLRSIAGMD